MKPTPENVQQEIQTITQYDYTVNPNLEQFLTHFSTIPLNTCFHDLCVKFYVYLEHLTSDNFWTRFKEKRVLKNIQKKNEKERKRKIMETVHSYKHSMHKFNTHSTCFDKMTDQNQEREIYCREVHKTVKNRNLQKHWK